MLIQPADLSLKDSIVKLLNDIEMYWETSKCKENIASSILKYKRYLSITVYDEKKKAYITGGDPISNNIRYFDLYKYIRSESSLNVPSQIWHYGYDIEVDHNNIEEAIDKMFKSILVKYRDEFNLIQSLRSCSLFEKLDELLICDKEGKITNELVYDDFTNFNSKYNSDFKELYDKVKHFHNLLLK